MIEWHPPSPNGYTLSSYRSPVGLIQVLHSGSVIGRAEFGDAALILPLDVPVSRGSLPGWIKAAFDHAFLGRADSSFPAIDWGFTELEKTLMSKATEIPFGMTSSYSNLAHWAGHPGRARSAGRAMSHSSIVYLVPTHRVIRQDGTPTLCQRDPLNAALRHFEHIDLAKDHAIMKPTQ